MAWLLICLAQWLHKLTASQCSKPIWRWCVQFDLVCSERKIIRAGVGRRRGLTGSGGWLSCNSTIWSVLIRFAIFHLSMNGTLLSFSMANVVRVKAGEMASNKLEWISLQTHKKLSYCIYTLSGGQFMLCYISQRQLLAPSHPTSQIPSNTFRYVSEHQHAHFITETTGYVS